MIVFSDLSIDVSDVSMVWGGTTWAEHLGIDYDYINDVLADLPPAEPGNPIQVFDPNVVITPTESLAENGVLYPPFLGDFDNTVPTVTVKFPNVLQTRS